MRERLTQLIAVAAALAVEDHLDGVLDRAVTAALALTPATYTSLGLVSAGVIVWQTAAGKPRADVRGYRQPLSQGFCGWVVRHGQARRVDDVTQTPGYLAQYPEIRAELDVPILSGERVAGVLSAESPEPAAFTTDDEILLQLLAAYVSLALRWVAEDGGESTAR
jgi:putative methionine-R-sulfoxide reductase with GAF domain